MSLFSQALSTAPPLHPLRPSPNTRHPRHLGSARIPPHPSSPPAFTLPLPCVPLAHSHPRSSAAKSPLTPPHPTPRRLRQVGLRPTLMAFPMMLVVVVSVIYSAPSMWTVFGGMVAIKGLSYALNNPSKEMLYMVRKAAPSSSPRT